MSKSALTAILVLATAMPAYAQEAPYSQTLDEQLQRVQSGQAAVPMLDQQAPVATSTANPAEAMQTMAPAAGADGMQPAAALPVAYDRHGQPIQSEGGGAIPALPLEMKVSSAGAYYLTGGVGEEEMAQLKSVETHYNLQVLIASKSGLYMSDATVRVLDEQNRELVMATDAGPYLFTYLHPGKYRVDVTDAYGTTKSVTTTVPKEGAAKPVVRFDN